MLIVSEVCKNKEVRYFSSRHDQLACFYLKKRLKSKTIQVNEA